MATVDLRPMREIEKEHILRVVTYLGGDVYRAADVLQVNARTLYRRLHSYGYRFRHIERKAQLTKLLAENGNNKAKAAKAAMAFMPKSALRYWLKRLP